MWCEGALGFESGKGKLGAGQLAPFWAMGFCGARLKGVQKGVRIFYSQLSYQRTQRGTVIGDTPSSFAPWNGFVLSRERSKREERNNQG